jgi:hypothetical protein
VAILEYLEYVYLVYFPVWVFCTKKNLATLVVNTASLFAQLMIYITCLRVHMYMSLQNGWSPAAFARAVQDVRFGRENRMHQYYKIILKIVSKPRLHWRSPFLKYFLWPMSSFLLSTHKQCILSHFIHNSTAMLP